MNDSTLSNMDGDLNSDTFPLCCWLFSTRFLISVFHLRVGSLLPELVLHPPFLALSCARIWGVRAGGRESSPNKRSLGLNSIVTVGTEDIKSPWLVEKNINWILYNLWLVWLELTVEWRLFSHVWHHFCLEWTTLRSRTFFSVIPDWLQ